MDIIDQTIKREGGFVDHPDDPGGATNMGVTLATLSHFLGREASYDEIRNLTHAEARAVYQARYMDAPRFSEIADHWLREIVFDAGVLFGPPRASRWLQEAAGVTADGIVGPATLRAVNAADPRQLGVKFITSWLRRHGERVQAGKSSPKFIGGWINRATSHLLSLPV